MVNGQCRSSICDLLHVSEATHLGKYLGSLVDLRASKRELSDYLREAIHHRIDGWAERLLSHEGKTVLIKSVALAVPIYQMSCFKVNKGFCKRVHTSFAWFWWHTGKEGVGKTWCSWEKKWLVTRNKGGLGFKKLELVNLTLLTKQF
ncbi:hypothetical protein Scep_014977 [Stephania cephalantha]|uniref:Reverse transcriptase n=1 Tax=Stephania cephalantha TaxID=152367 RepID=A0AAP0P3I7_9MAGN